MSVYGFSDSSWLFETSDPENMAFFLGLTEQYTESASKVDPGLPQCPEVEIPVNESKPKEDSSIINVTQRIFAETIEKSPQIDPPLIALSSSQAELHPLDLQRVVKLNFDPEIAKLTKKIFKLTCFIKEPSRDQGYETRDNQTVAEVQGCSSFCQKAYKYCARNPLVLSPYYLRNWQVQDRLSNKQLHNNTYLSLKYKRIGHVFSLDKMIRLPRGEKVQLCGSNETLLFPPLQAAFAQFASSRKDLINDKMRISMIKSLSETVWHENASDERIDEIHKNIHDLTYYDPIIIGSGHVWHSTQTIFCREPSDDSSQKKPGEMCVLHINRGDGCGKKSGIIVLKLKSTAGITKDFIKKLVKRMDVRKEDHINLSKMIEVLKADEISYIPMKVQKVGNCVYSSYKTVFYALLLIERIKENPELSNFNFSKKVQGLAKHDYKEFIQFDATDVLEDFLIDLKEAVPENASTEEDESYLNGLEAVAASLIYKLSNYAFKINMGEKKKISLDLIKTTMASIECFFKQISLQYRFTDPLFKKSLFD